MTTPQSGQEEEQGLAQAPQGQGLCQALGGSGKVRRGWCYLESCLGTGACMGAGGVAGGEGVATRNVGDVRGGVLELIRAHQGTGIIGK